MNKRQKALVSAFIVLLILVSLGAVWFSEASINYAFNYDFYYKKNDENWYTFNWVSNNQTEGMLVSVECYNVGLMDGSYFVIVEFTGATLSKQTTQPYVQLNNSTAKFPLSLHSHEHQAMDVYFNVDRNVKSFNVKVTFEGNQAFIRSAETNPFSLNTMDYFLNQSGDSYVIGALPA
jgi:hypothetical protein